MRRAADQKHIYKLEWPNSARTIPTGSSLGLTKIIITTLYIIHDTRGHLVVTSA